ncbi:MAG: acyl carrier protein [Clostridia bacterium]|nr:acyl carrier protein [Clostridia bacterium]
MLEEKEIYDGLNEIFQDVFDDASICVSANTTAEDIDDWDSLEHIRLVAAVERHFGMRFKMGEVASMKNVGEMVSIIRSRV